MVTGSELASVADLMRSASDVMARFPADYVPPSRDLPNREPADTKQWISGSSVQELLSNPDIQSWLQEIIDSLPGEFIAIFLQSSSIVAQILAMFGVDGESNMVNTMGLAVSDPETLQLMMALAQVERETENLKDVDDYPGSKDPLGFKKAAIIELERRRIAFRTPFARTLTTILGPDALLWLVAQSQEGTGKIQPHEFSRTGWCRISEIETQTAIEQELLAVDPEAEQLSKIVVAMSWTLAGLASFVTPSVFLEEHTSHLISLSGGQYTVASGTGARTLVAFHTSHMRSLVEILAEALTNPLLSSPDVMWIGAALARVRDVTIRHTEPTTVVEEKFSLFLSHRGRDAKRPLSEAVRGLPPTHGVFLDCMTLPRGVINRSFIYNSLARSARILIVETENYDESEWCKKEAWFSQEMAKHGLSSVERISLGDAVPRVGKQGRQSIRRRNNQQLDYPISNRVLRDIDYWARTPNLHSLKETGHSIETIEGIQEIVSGQPRPQDAEWIKALGSAVSETLERVVNDTPEASPIDLWATALQFSVAAFASTSNARSKDEVRRGIDHLNAVLKSLVDLELHLDPVFQSKVSGYLALLAAASAIQLAGFDLDERMTPAVRIAVADTAMMYDGLLLLDAREPGARRDFQLQLITVLIKENLGGVGIVQNASDEVHQKRIDGISLEILPCVTLHPGIEAPYMVTTTS